MPVTTVCELRQTRRVHALPMSFWVYMLECGDESIYTGHTDDLELRLAQHRMGEMGSAYTNDRKRLRLIWCQEFPTREEALARERQIKGWTRRKKLALARGDYEALHRWARSTSANLRDSAASTPDLRSSAQHDR